MRLTTVLRRRWCSVVAVSGLSALTLVATPAARADEFRNGTGIATAQIVRISPGVGGLGLSTTVGTSLSKVANKIAEAQAQAVDLGLVGSSLTAESCDGSPGALTPDQLPQPLVADNRKGDSSATEDEYPVAPQLGGGRKEVNAKTVPSSEATVTGVAATVDPLVKVANGRSDAMTRIVDKDAREAVGSASIDLDLGGGAVVLKNLEWLATHRTGAGESITGAFSIGDGTIGAVPAPVDQLGTLQSAVNSALAETGISISLPHVEHITKPNDVIKVTPLVISLRDTPAGKAALGPVLNASREQREQVFTQIASAYCQASGALLVGDIGLDIVSGTGFLNIELGGVSATTADLESFNPFGSNEPFGDITSVLPSLIPADTALPSLAPTGITAPPISAGAASLGPIRNVCESLSKSKRVGCSRGAAVPVGIIGILLTATVGGLDWLRRRRGSAALPA
jgi:hypothetical protein